MKEGKTPVLLRIFVKENHLIFKIRITHCRPEFTLGLTLKCGVYNTVFISYNEKALAEMYK